MNDHIPIPELTRQEQKILSYLVEGLPNRKIAERLFISPSTVKWHIRQLNNKLVTNNRIEIVERATAMGLVQPDAGATHSADEEAGYHNLPNDLTPFIGRDVELEQLETILRDDNVYLLTLAGPGGVGKTRLAIALARKVLPHYPQGVYFVSLAGKTTLDGTASAILVELNATVPISTSPSDHLLTVFGDQQCLLILDNFEQLLSITSYIMRLLQLSPNLTVLVTSRVRLNINAETIFNLHGLPYGDASPAEHLLAERIRAHISQPVDPANEDIGRICALTGGLPLALVLAATWSDTLELNDLAAEIENSIDILANDQSDIPPRQRSIRATLDYSWKHLSETERKAAAQLSLFVSGFQREAAQAVAEVNLPMLKALVRRSILVLDDGRYRMHELVRQYAEDALRSDANLYQTTQADYTHYLAEYVASAINSAMFEGGISYADMILAEHDNILSAWDNIIINEDYLLVSQVIRAISITYQQKRTWHDTYELGMRTVNLLQPLLHDIDNVAKMVAVLNTMTWAVAWLGRPQETIQFARMQEDLAKKLADAGDIKVNNANLPISVAFAYAQMGEFEAAIEEAQVGLDRSLADESIGSGTHVMVACRMLGDLYILTAGFEQAEQYLQQALEAVAAMDGTWVRWWRCKTAIQQAKLAYIQGDLNEMEQQFGVFMSCEDAAHDLNSHAEAAYYKAQIALDQQDFPAAEVNIQDSVALYERTGYRPGLYIALADSAYAQIGVGAMEEARQELLYVLEDTDANVRVTIIIMLAIAFYLLSWQAHLDLAKGLLRWISNHPSAEFFTRKRAQQLMDRYGSDLRELDVAPLTNDQVLHFRQDAASLLASLSHDTVQ